MKEGLPNSEAWLEVLDLLDKYQLSADDVMSIAEELYDMAQEYLEELSEKQNRAEPQDKARKLASYATIRNPAFDKFPLFKDTWGLDPSLIYEDN